MAKPENKLPPGLASRFELLERIGRGSFGEVLRVRDRALSRVVALKLIEPTCDAAMLARFQREAASLARVKHPNVVQVYAHGVEDHQPYLVMELLAGRSFEALPAGTDPLEAMLPVADALGVVHQAGMVHRDVKPANIFMTTEGRPVLLDFGLVLVPAATRITLPNLLVGTLAFVSPEALQGGKVDEGEDWYAWGATLFWLHEGRCHRTTDALMASAQGAPTPPIRFEKASTPSKVRALLRAMLDWPAAERVKGAAEIRVFLEAEGAARTVAAAPVGSSDPVGAGVAKAAGPGPARLGLGVGLGLGLLLSAGFVLGRRGDAPVDPPPGPPARPVRTLPAPPEAALVLAEAEAKAVLGQDPPGRVSGWVGSAVLAGRSLAVRVASLEADVSSIAATGRRPAALATERGGLKVVALGGFDAFVEGLLSTPDARGELEAWMRPAAEDFRRMFSEAALAAAADPGQGELAAALVREAALRYRQVGWVAFRAARPGASIPEAGPEPAARYLEGLALLLGAEGTARAGLDPGEPARAAAATLAAAAPVDPAAPKAMLPVLAVLDRIAALDLARDLEALVDCWAAGGGAVLAIARQKSIVAVLGPVLRAIEAGRPGRLAEPDLAATVRWLEKRRDKLAGEGWGAPVVALYDRLAAQSPRKPE